MNTNEDTQPTTPSDVTIFGVASVDTQGGPLAGEVIGGINFLGISEE